MKASFECPEWLCRVIAILGTVVIIIGVYIILFGIGYYILHFINDGKSIREDIGNSIFIEIPLFGIFCILSSIVIFVPIVIFMRTCYDKIYNYIFSNSKKE